jgi:AhpD family alkylhydroperoxidase
MPVSDSAKQFFEEWKVDQANMKERTPGMMKAFGGLFQETMKEGALSVREKELMALAIGLAVRCAPCINLHVEKCLKAGATREQILEAAGVAVMMQGGPSYTHVPLVIRALDHLEGSK